MKAVERLFRGVERSDFAIDAGLAHAARDELRHLAAEVDDEDGFGRLDRHVGPIVTAVLKRKCAGARGSPGALTRPQRLVALVAVDRVRIVRVVVARPVVGIAVTLAVVAVVDVDIGHEAARIGAASELDSTRHAADLVAAVRPDLDALDANAAIDASIAVGAIAAEPLLHGSAALVRRHLASARDVVPIVAVAAVSAAEDLVDDLADAAAAVTVARITVTVAGIA